MTTNTSTKNTAQIRFSPHPRSFRWNVANNNQLPQVLKSLDTCCGDAQQPSSLKNNVLSHWNGDPKHLPPAAIGLTTADMDFPTSTAMKQVIHEYAETGCFIYPTQLPELAPVTLKRIHEHYNAPQLTEADIVFFPGVVSAMNALLWALNHDHRPYTLLTPNYPPLFYLTQPDRVLEVPLLDITHENPAQRGRIDYTLLKTRMTEQQSHVIVITNPSNPLGKVWSHAELSELKAFAAANQFSLISDEIWIDWTFDKKATSTLQLLPAAAGSGETESVDIGCMKQTQNTDETQGTRKHISAEVIAPTLATVMASSKTFNLGGLNCAYIVTTNAALRKKLTEYLKFYSVFPSQLAQAMLIHLYQHGEPTFQGYRSQVIANRKLLEKACREQLPGIKPLLGNANHVAWLDASALPLDNPAAFFLEKARVHLFHGSAFGTGYHHFMRINLATYPEILEEAFSRMAFALKHL